MQADLAKWRGELERSMSELTRVREAHDKERETSAFEAEALRGERDAAVARLAEGEEQHGKLVAVESALQDERQRGTILAGEVEDARSIGAEVERNLEEALARVRETEQRRAAAETRCTEVIRTKTASSLLVRPHQSPPLSTLIIEI